MLPHFVWADFLDVLADLRRTASTLDPEWFEAQLEFRFPFCGEVEYEGVKLELRQALEPWHVMGEQGAIGGTVRFVDSSVERLQVKLEGAQPRALRRRLQRPPRAADARPATAGVAVAGVRFKAWQPAIGPAPDAAGQRAAGLRHLRHAGPAAPIGGCVYHVAHPGGRNYETFPVNGNEAEARRLARFEPRGHTPAAYVPARRTSLRTSSR